MEIKVLLPELMKARGLNQKELALAVGLNQRTVGQLYRGASTRIDIETIKKIAIFFGLKNSNQLILFEVEESGCDNLAA
jgi:transcriptional regulator with XRE-family HTH domain